VTSLTEEAGFDGVRARALARWNGPGHRQAPHAAGGERDGGAPRLIDLRAVRVEDLDIDDAPDEWRVRGHDETNAGRRARGHS
jgi:hypothetical protein